MIIFSLALLCTLGYIILNGYVYNLRRKYKHIKSPPIPLRFTWILGLIPEIRKKYAQSPNASAGHALMEYHYEYKWNLFVIPVFTKNILFCMELDILAKVLADWRTYPKDKNYHKTFTSVNGVRIFGKYGLLSDPGTEVWNAKRRAMDPGFHKSFMRSIMPGMNIVTGNLLSLLRTKAGDGVFDLCPVLNRSAFEAISLCGFNMDSDTVAMHGDQFVKTVPTMLKGMSLSVRESTFKYPWKFREEKKALRDTVPVMREVVKNLLMDRMKSNHDQAPTSSDILSHIIKSNQCSDQLTIDDLVDDYVVFLVAGMETTAITMAITLFYLANNSKIFFKVRNEIDNVVKRSEILKFEDVSKLDYLEMVIKECMRLKPPVCGVGRCCAKDNVIVNGLKIPEGAVLFVPIMGLHHDERYWENPDVFDPERFNPESHKKITKFSYLPFMAGARSCIGKNFAMLEAKMIVSQIVQEFDIENPYPDVTDLETTGMVTARPVDGVKLKLHPRLAL